MSTVTLDASVVVAQLAPEPLSARASAMWNDLDARPIAPTLLTTEVTSALSEKVRRGEMDLPAAEARLSFFRRMPVTTIDERALALHALRLSVLLGHHVPDCVYLAVAIAHHAPLVTADQELCRRTQEAGLGKHVVLLEV